MKLSVDGNEGVMDLLLKHDSAFRVQERLVAETVAMPFHQNVMKVYLRHGHSLVLTEEVVKAAAGNLTSGTDALEIVFRYDSVTKITNTMILEALQSPRGAALITLMLESDPTIAMQEDYLIVAASNPYEGAVIFEALHQKNLISFCSSTVEATQARPAKRQRISLDSSLSLRDKGTKSAQITRKVIEAAAANKKVKQRRQFQCLFDKWGVLTEEDRMLFDLSDSDEADYSDSDKTDDSDCNDAASSSE